MLNSVGRSPPPLHAVRILAGGLQQSWMFKCTSRLEHAEHSAHKSDRITYLLNPPAPNCLSTTPHRPTLQPMTDPLQTLLAAVHQTRAAREDLYVWFHQHPELSMQEDITADRIRQRLDELGISWSAVGHTGTVCVLDNGTGPVVALRGDIDALPVRESSGKEYASTAVQVDEQTGGEVPTMHACGHDFHITALLGALEAFHTYRDTWSGTLVGVFQPGEETAAGARAMVDDGIGSAIPTPDVYLGQHVLPALHTGTVGTRLGPVMSKAFSGRITVWGKGTHGSMPEKGVDPVLLAANIITRLHTVVSREIAAKETVVLTVSSVHAGTKANVIPDSAEMLINTRAYSTETSDYLRAAIERVVRAECTAARSPRAPEFEYFDEFPLTDNDAGVTARVRKAFDAHFGSDATDLDQIPASEDFSIIPDALGVPYCYWGLGGFKDWEDAPGNHSPTFAPDLQPTLDRGTEAMIVAAAAWLVEGAR